MGSAATLELNIEADLQALRDRLEEAAEASAERSSDPLAEALDETRDLVRGVEAMRRRLEESPEDGGGARGQPGEPGDAGEAGGAASDGGTVGGATRGDPRRLGPGEVRQFRSEFGQRGDQVRELRNRLREAGRDGEDLQAVLDAMARLEREGVYDNPAQVASLQEEILQLLLQLEFGLRREVEGGGERRTTLSGSDEVPEEYRSLVEEYYRELARGGRGGQGGS